MSSGERSRSPNKSGCGKSFSLAQASRSKYLENEPVVSGGLIKLCFPTLPCLPNANSLSCLIGLQPGRNPHPTVKPLKLMHYLITLGSREGDIVLDIFAGSGTTLVAAKKLNRRFIGFEISEEYCEIARERLKQEVLGL